MKILITGAAGFIGSHLHNMLSPKHKVIGIDDLRTGDVTRISNTENLIAKDLNDLEESRLLEVLSGCDAVFHLAAEKHNTFRESTTQLLDSNIVASEKLFRLAGKANVKNVIFSSTLYVYGQTGPKIMRLEDAPMPNTLYGISKFASERMLELYANQYSYKWHSPRFFFVYGPNQFASGGYKSVIIKNMQSAIQSGKVTIFGDGKQSLDYIYVDDVTNALEKMMHVDFSTGITNVSTGRKIEIREIIDFIVQKSGAEIQYEDPDWTAGSVRYGDPAKLNRILNWYPKTDILEGLELTWKSISNR